MAMMYHSDGNGDNEDGDEDGGEDAHHCVCVGGGRSPCVHCHSDSLA